MDPSHREFFQKNSAPLIIGGSIIVAGIFFGVISRPSGGPSVAPSSSSGPAVGNSSSLVSQSAPSAAQSAEQVALLRRMLVDQVPYYGKDVTLTLSLTPDTYYNFKYSDSKDSHYSFKVAEGEGIGSGMYIYASRAKFADLFNYVVDNPSVPVKVVVTATPANGDPQIWDLVSWSKS